MINLARGAPAPLQFAPEDTVIEEEVPIIVGGKGVLIKMLQDFILKGIHLPMEIFDTQVKLSEKSKQIKKATLKPQIDDSAERIAAVVNADRPLAPATLQGLVREEAVSSTASL